MLPLTFGQLAVSTLKQEENNEKQILLAIGLAGGAFCYPHFDARADIPLAMGTRSSPGFNFESRPDFIYLDDYGFSVSWGGPYDVVYTDNAYFIYRDGYWYRARDYRGPWGRIRDLDLPPSLRRHNWNDINRRRDFEYRRHDRGFWENQFRQERERWRDRDGRPGPGGPPPGPNRDWRDGR